MARVRGTARNDKLRGTQSNDLVYGLNGDDVLIAGSGNDRVYGGNGRDFLYGQNGNDFLDGGAGNDRLYGQNGNDTVYARNGNDVLDGGAGTDRLYGQNGNDYLFGRDGNDVLHGGNGVDRLYGQNGNDYLLGNAGNDVLQGGNGNDRLYGQDGNDYLLGNAGNDVIQAGNGNDRIWGQDGNDSVLGNAGNDVVRGDAGNDKVWGQDGNDSLLGGSGDDTLWGGNGDDVLDGGTGTDLLIGGEGNDILDGGLGGGDTLHGHSGDDVLIYRDGARSRIDGGADIDTLKIVGISGNVDFTRARVVEPEFDFAIDDTAYAGAATFDFSAGIFTTIFPIHRVSTTLGGEFLIGGGTLTTNNALDRDGEISYSLEPGSALLLRYDVSDGLVDVRGADVPSVDGSSLVQSISTGSLSISGLGHADLLIDAGERAIEGVLSTPTAVTLEGPGVEVFVGPGIPSAVPAPTFIDPVVSSIEVIDLSGDVDRLVLTQAQVRDLPGEVGVDTLFNFLGPPFSIPVLSITGDAGDRVNVGEGWVWHMAGDARNGLEGDGIVYRKGDTYLEIAGDVVLEHAPLARDGYASFGNTFGDGAVRIDLDNAVTGVNPVRSPFVTHGWSAVVGGGGDINGDGFNDARFNRDYASSEDVPRIISGADVTTEKTIHPPEVAVMPATGAASDHFAIDIIGDFNADGLADFAMARTDEGELFETKQISQIFFGREDLDFPSGLPQLAAEDGSSYVSYERSIFGFESQVSGIGDVNADGYDDVAISGTAFTANDLPADFDAELEPNGDLTGGIRSTNYIVYGRAGAGEVEFDLTQLTDGGDGYLLTTGGLWFDASSSAGDFNGDGFGDFLIGDAAHNFYNLFDEGGGVAHLVFGEENGEHRSLEPGEYAPHVLQLFGSNDLDRLGWAVAGIGDFDGDGLDDIAVSAPGNNPSYNTSDETGSVYVIYGIAGLTGISIDLSNLGELGFRIDGIEPGHALGASLSSAGDFNGDGYDDLAIGALGVTATEGGAYHGATYVLFGGSERLTGEWRVDEFGFNEIIEFYPSSSFGQIGRSIDGAGDLNGDGFDDLLIGDSSYDLAPSDAYIVLGRGDLAPGSSPNAPVYLIDLQGTTGDDVLSGTAADEIIIADSGNDLIDGSGGNDVIRAAHGDDTVVYDAADQLSVDGGSGIDTLRIDDSDLALDFNKLQQFENFERIDLTGSGDNSLQFDIRDILGFVGHAATFVESPTYQLLIDGDTGDAVQSVDQGWVQEGDVSIDGSLYRSFTHADIAAQVFVDPLVDSTLT